MSVSGYHRVKEIKELKSVANEANKLYNLGSEAKNINAYLRDKPNKSFLESHFVDFKKYISKKQIVVNVPIPKVTGTTKHYIDNLQNKKDTAKLTLKNAKSW